MSFIEEIKQDYEEYKSNKLRVQDVINLMLKKYGENSQIDVAIEEMAELAKELLKYKRTKLHNAEKQATNRAKILEELSDVMFMLGYIKTIFKISEEEVSNTIADKASRVFRRYL